MGNLTFRGARQTVGLEVARAFLPPVLLSVGVGGGGRVELGAGGAGDTGAGAHRVAQPRVCRRTGKGKRTQVLTLKKADAAKTLKQCSPEGTPSPADHGPPRAVYVTRGRWVGGPGHPALEGHETWSKGTNSQSQNY